jgi:protein-S-isoprenylcysteine O-methyltransferase Ste14
MFLPNKNYETVLIIAIAVIPLTMLFFSQVPTPYGRFFKENIWGPNLDEKNAWAIMEATGLVMFLIFYYSYGCFRTSMVPLLFLGLWIFHYINRAIIYPFVIMKQKHKKFPLILVVLGFFYLSMYSYLNAKNVSCNPKYTNDWVKSPAFIIGVIIFFIGFIINVWADIRLRFLHNNKKQDKKEDKEDEKNDEKDEKIKKSAKFYEDGSFNFSKMFDSSVYYDNVCKKHYYIPDGGLYDYVSSPNYMGEILEWSGWAIATWSVPGLLFALGAIGCIGVRSIHTHKWYNQCFPDYPKERKALIPFIL